MNGKDASEEALKTHASERVRILTVMRDKSIQVLYVSITAMLETPDFPSGTAMRFRQGTLLPAEAVTRIVPSAASQEAELEAFRERIGCKKAIKAVVMGDQEFGPWSSRAMQMMERLDALSPLDLEAVLDWLCGLLPFIVSDEKDAVHFHINRTQIIEKLHAMGFQNNANIGANHDANNRDNYGVFLIGQVLANLSHNQKIFENLPMLVSQWKERFSAKQRAK